MLQNVAHLEYDGLTEVDLLTLLSEHICILNSSTQARRRNELIKQAAN